MQLNAMQHTTQNIQPQHSTHTHTHTFYSLIERLPSPPLASVPSGRAHHWRLLAQLVTRSPTNSIMLKLPGSTTVAPTDQLNQESVFKCTAGRWTNTPTLFLTCALSLSLSLSLSLFVCVSLSTPSTQHRSLIPCTSSSYSISYSATVSTICHHWHTGGFPPLRLSARGIAPAQTSAECDQPKCGHCHTLRPLESANLSPSEACRPPGRHSYHGHPRLFGWCNTWVHHGGADPPCAQL